MTLTYEWLKDFLIFDVTPLKLSEILTNIGLEVDNYEIKESIKGGLKGLVVGEIVAIAPHPDAEKLNITEVKISDNTTENLQIVCGASNVVVGLKVAVASVNTLLYPTDAATIKIKKTKIRGVESNGMLCAEDEIGLSSDHNGILELPTETQVGRALAEVLNVEVQHIYEIGLTPNRNDAMNIEGIAKDIYAYLKTNNIYCEWKQPPIFKPVDIEIVPIEIDNSGGTLCPIYAGIVLTDVVIKPSPIWMQKRLEAVGLRCKNNVIDIANYILWKYGQPLHAFDYDKIEGKKITIIEADKTEEFIGLDGIKYTLQPNDIIIKDTLKPLCIAGIIGGQNSSITPTTKTIFLESACFDAKQIRKTSSRINLKTDASRRFEKQINPHRLLPALHRAVALLVEHADAKIASHLYESTTYAKTIHPIKLRFDRVNKITGTIISKKEILTIIENLELKINKITDEYCIVESPSNKTDVVREIDVIEEILRIYGLNKIPIHSKFVFSQAHKEIRDAEKLKNKIAQTLVVHGFYETITNTLARSHKAKIFFDYEHLFVPLLSSINTELDILTPHVLLNELEHLALNQNNQMHDARFFNFSKVYHKIENKYVEKQHLLLSAYGNTSQNEVNSTNVKADIYWLKSVVLAVLKQVNQLKIVEEAIIENDCIAEGIVYKMKNIEIAWIGEIKPTIKKYWDLKKPVSIAIVDWETVITLSKNETITYKEPIKYPVVKRDLSIILQNSVEFRHLQQTVNKLKLDLLKDISIFDVYSDDKIGAQLKSYSLSFSFQNNTKTLTDIEVDGAMMLITDTLLKEHNAKIRS